MSVAIRPAKPGDEGEIMRLVRDLAVYEKLLHEVQSTPELLAAALFAESPRVFCDLAEEDGKAIGFAVWFYTYSTFVGRAGIYLEDLFVEPAARGRGIGKALLRQLGGRCVAEGLGRLEWSVLDWNAPAIAFYRGQGANIHDEWRICRVSGDALKRLGEADG